ncbi:MAG: ScpA family protein [Candidatus Magasanikbacteria bacterium]
MVSDIKLEKFEGPLDLLLQLVELEKMNISEVVLSEVTDQFLLYLDKLESNRSDELADFLVIATKLVYLKSRTLLPYLYPEEDDGPSLADQLKMYQQYVEASKKINIFWSANRIAYGRTEPPIKPDGFVMPANAQVGDLYNSIIALVNRLRPINPLPTATIDHTISVKHKIEAIYNLIKSRKHLGFKELLSDAHNRTEVIISFLALLELVKDSKASVHQGKSFSDMEVRVV